MEPKAVTSPDRGVYLGKGKGMKAVEEVAARQAVAASSISTTTAPEAGRNFWNSVYGGTWYFWSVPFRENESRTMVCTYEQYMEALDTCISDINLGHYRKKQVMNDKPLIW